MEFKESPNLELLPASSVHGQAPGHGSDRMGKPGSLRPGVSVSLPPCWVIGEHLAQAPQTNPRALWKAWPISPPHRWFHFWSEPLLKKAKEEIPSLVQWWRVLALWLRMIYLSFREHRRPQLHCPHHRPSILGHPRHVLSQMKSLLQMKVDMSPALEKFL